MTAWLDRSPVAAAMLNPALLAAVTAAATEEYVRATDEAMPWALAFLVAPLTLHRDTREALPKRASSHWTKWVSDNPVLVAGFPARAKSLTDATREGIRFGLARGALVADDHGSLRGGLARRARPARVGDITEVVRAAGFVGRWLTKLDQPATAFALLGVTP
jgi:Family of unknown function (DUF6521)